MTLLFGQPRESESSFAFLTSKASFDYLIIGQGLAGSLFALALEKRGLSFLIVDENDPLSASRVSTGVINPVTGRRLARSWRVEEMLAAPGPKGEFLHLMPILKLFGSTQEENDWTARVSPNDPFVKEVMSVESDAFNPARGVLITGGGRLETSRMLSTLRQRWLNGGVLRNEKFEVDDLVGIEEPTPLRWKDFDFKRIVFCDGVASRPNPFFHPLRFVLSKGEYLSIHCPDVPSDRIIGSKYLLVPQGDGHFTFGSTYDRDDLSPRPTEAARAELESRLKKLLRVPYEVTGHHFGIRPSTYDRRPLMGVHPKDTRLVIFNGLGSKGALMAPWLAEHLLAHLEDGVDLDRECWWLR